MLNVSLSQDTWNSILMLLAEHPYKISAPLIQGITNCLREQMQEAQQQIPQTKSNGNAQVSLPV